MAMVETTMTGGLPVLSRLCPCVRRSDALDRRLIFESVDLQQLASGAVRAIKRTSPHHSAGYLPQLVEVSQNIPSTVPYHMHLDGLEIDGCHPPARQWG
jgi:hypothetical protein